MDTVQWSWELLDVEEQRALAAFSVFRGGAGLDALEALIGGAPGEAAELVDALLGHGLLRVVDGRVFAYVGVQDFASERLRQSGERDAVLQHYRQWFASRARHEWREVSGPNALRAMTWLQVERPNLLHALGEGGPGAGDIAVALLVEWELESASDHEIEAVACALSGTLDPVQRMRLLRVLCWGRYHQAQRSPTQAVLEELLVSLAQVSDEDASFAWLTVGQVRAREGDIPGSQEAFCHCIALAPSLSAQSVRATLEIAVEVGRAGDRERGLELASNATQRAITLGGAPYIAFGRMVMAHLLAGTKRYERAMAEVRGALKTYEAMGAHTQVALNHALLGVYSARKGRPEEGLRYMDQSVQLGQRFCGPIFDAVARQQRAAVRLQSGQFSDALDDALLSVQTSQRLRADPMRMNPQLVLAECWIELDDLEEARRALDACLDLLENPGSKSYFEDYCLVRRPL